MLQIHNASKSIELNLLYKLKRNSILRYGNEKRLIETRVWSQFIKGENTEAGSRNLLQIFLIALKNVHALHCGFLTVHSDNYA